MRYRIKEESPTKFVVQKRARRASWSDEMVVVDTPIADFVPLTYGNYDEAAEWIKLKRLEEPKKKIKPKYHYVSNLPDFDKIPPPPPSPMMDWNTLNLDELAKVVKEEFAFDSSGIAKAAQGLVKFYEESKPRINDLEETVIILEKVYFSNRELTKGEGEIVRRVRKSIDK